MVGAGGWGCPEYGQGPGHFSTCQTCHGGSAQTTQALTLTHHGRRGTQPTLQTRQEAVQSLKLAHLPDSTWLTGTATVYSVQKIKSDTVSPSISHEVMGPDAVIFVF